MFFCFSIFAASKYKHPHTDFACAHLLDCPVVPAWRQENILRLDDYYCGLSNFALNARLSTQVPLPFWLKLQFICNSTSPPQLKQSRCDLNPLESTPDVTIQYFLAYYWPNYLGTGFDVSGISQPCFIIGEEISKLCWVGWMVNQYLVS